MELTITEKNILKTTLNERITHYRKQRDENYIKILKAIDYKKKEDLSFLNSYLERQMNTLQDIITKIS